MVAGVSVAMLNSMFWAFAPASVYARLEGVPKVRVLVLGRLLHVVIAAACAFALVGGAYVQLSASCENNACWELQNYLGPAIGVAIGAGILLKLVNAVIGAR